MYQPRGGSGIHRDGVAVGVQVNPVGEMIRQAEEYIASHEFARAQDCLAEAWQRDPGNAYIPAIMERMEILQSLMRTESSKENRMSDPLRYLALSVGKEFEGGINPIQASFAESSSAEQNARVRRLTTVALSLLERGAVESAFQALMKAYIVDPAGPEIIACANKVLPAWEAFCARAGDARVNPAPRRTDDSGAAAAEARRIASVGGGAASGSVQSNAGASIYERRILALKRQREAERCASEREMWRAASKLTGSALTGQWPDGHDQNSSPTSSAGKRGFLTSWVRRRLSD
jgi:hypothetical protein